MAKKGRPPKTKAPVEQDPARDIIAEAAAPEKDDRFRAARVLPKATLPIKKAALQMVEDVLKANERGPEFFAGQLEKAKTAVSTKTVYEAFCMFEEAVGGRAKLLEVLNYCPEGSNAYLMMTKLLKDPALVRVALSQGDDEQSRYALADLCKKNSIPFNALVAAFRDAKSAQMAVEALMTVSHHTPVVMEQLAEDAQNRWVDCTTCKGVGRVRRLNDQGEFALDEYGEYMTQLCFNCRGDGKVWTKHDFQNRKAFLEFTGLIKKEPLVQNNIDNRSVSIGQGAPGDGTFEGVMKSLDVLVRKPKPEEAEVIEAEVVNVQQEDNE